MSDGGSRRVIRRSSMLQPFSITIFEDQLYWSDTARKAIFQANKFDGTGFHMMRRNVKSPMGISIIHKSRQAHGKLITSNCYIARMNTKRDWLICGHVALDKCNVSRRVTSEKLFPSPNQ
jgi:hypothetical protein